MEEKTMQGMPPDYEAEVLILKGGSPQQVKDRLSALKEAAPTKSLSALVSEVDAAGYSGEFVLAIAAESSQKLLEKAELVLKAEGDLWEKAPSSFAVKGINLGRRKASTPKVGFLFPGQGSQFVDMLKDLSQRYPVVAETFAEADEVLADRIGGKLTDLLFTKGGETPERLAEMQAKITQTEITQPAVLCADVAMLRLLRLHGVDADTACGHSLGEYGALVAAGTLEFRDALRTVSERARSMVSVNAGDNGKMASVSAPVEKVEPVLKQVQGYVVAVNKNCPTQTVIAGASAAVEEAVKACAAAGLKAQLIQVSHAFHSEIVAPATEPFGKFLAGIPVRAPRFPVLSNATALYYPPDEVGIRSLMVRQIAMPVEFIREVERMYADGVRVFIEVGPRRTLGSFASSILEGKADAFVTSSNHPKKGGIIEFNDLLGRLAAAGLDVRRPSVKGAASPEAGRSPLAEGPVKPTVREGRSPVAAASAKEPASKSSDEEPHGSAQDSAQDLLAKWDLYLGPVVVSGVSVGLPGSGKKIFREDALDSILRGENLIENLSPEELRKQLDKNLRASAGGEGEDESSRKSASESAEAVIRLAGVAGEFDMSKEFGIRGSISSLMDITAKLALAAGILALKDAGIPLVRHYKKNPKTGKLVPGPWALPDSVGDETGVIMACAFPGLDSLIEDISRYFTAKYVGKPERELAEVYERMLMLVQDPAARRELTEWYEFRRRQQPLGGTPVETYAFSRSWLMRILAMGHGQTAQFLRARGPCTQINAACASTTQAVGLAEDWIRTGRAKRVLVVSSENPTSPTLMQWLGTGFLATGAATTHGVVEEAALPFDRRRNGMIMGMGAAGLVIEDGREAQRRGVTPRSELLAVQFENSAYHVTRMDEDHVAAAFERLVSKVERRHGLGRREIAEKALFMSHETYTPAQGGCSVVEAAALKRVFGKDMGGIVVCNTKGFTGHAMGASMEDVVSIHAMNAGRLPPIANYKEPDPLLADMTLSRGGEYDREFAIRLSAGFGSQIVIAMHRRLWRCEEPRIPDAARYREWLSGVSGQPEPETEVVLNTLRVKEAAQKAPGAGAPAVTTLFRRPEPPKPAPPVRAWRFEASPGDLPVHVPALSTDKAVVILPGGPESAPVFAEAVQAAGGQPVCLRSADWASLDQACTALRAALKERKCQGILDLSGLDLGDIDSLTPSSFDRSYRRSSRALLLAVRALREDLLAGPSWVVAAMKDRQGQPRPSPLAGALAGLARGLAAEVPGVRVAALEFDSETPPKDMARLALAETAGEAGPAEARYAEGRRWARSPVRQVLPDELPDPKRRVSTRTVALISGGGTGFGAEVAKALARRHKCTLFIVGPVPLSREAASWARMSPEELAEVARRAPEAPLAAEIQRNIEDMCRSGSRAAYLEADPADAGSVAKAVKAALKPMGTVDLFIHAPPTRSPAPGQPLEDFDRDLRAAAHGAFHLVRGAPVLRSQRWVFLSSAEARFGAAGPGPAAAGAVLSSMAATLAAQGRRAMALDVHVGPADGSSSLPGMTPMPLEEAVDTVLTEIDRNLSDTEILIAATAGSPAAGPAAAAPEEPRAAAEAAQSEPQPQLATAGGTHEA